MMTFIFSEIREENKIPFINQEYFLQILYLEIGDNEKYFYKEINDFCRECEKIALELYSLFKDFNLYSQGVLDYQYADLTDDLLILHKPSINNI